jgi:shikimate kinase
MKNNITIIGPRAIGKSTVSKIIAREYHLNYVEFDTYLDKHLIKYGGLVNALTTGKAQEALNKEMPDYIRRILEEQKILLDIGGGAISSMHKTTNKKNLEIILNGSLVIPLIYSDNILKSAKILQQREVERKYPTKDFERIKEDYERFLSVIQENSLVPIYCEDKSIGEVCEEVDKKISGK